MAANTRSCAMETARCGGICRLRAASLAVIALSMTLTIQIARSEPASPAQQTKFVDLSLLVAPEMPCTWPAPGFRSSTSINTCGSDRSRHTTAMLLMIDGNTGTQLDVPPHSVPHPDTNLPNAGPYGRVYTDKVPAWQFCGEACVIDCRDLRDGKTNGRSELVTKERIARLGATAPAARARRRGVVPQRVFGQVLPAACRQGAGICADPVEGSTPAWPDPDPDCMEYLAESQSDGAGHRQHEHGPAARSGRADAPRRPQVRHDLDRVG